MIKRFRYVILFTVLIMMQQSGITQHKGLSLTVSPAWVTFGVIAVQPGIAYRFNDHWGMQADFCYASPSRQKTSFDRTSLFRTGLELKRFFGTKEVRTYASFQTAYFYRKIIALDSGSFYVKNDFQRYYTYQNAVIHSPLISFAVKGGVEVDVTRTIVLDMFFGLGARTVFTHYDAGAVGSNQTFAVRERLYAPIASYRYNYTVTRFHMPLGLRLGITI